MGIDCNARSFQALTAILDYVTHLASMSIPDEFRPSQATLL